MLTKTLVSLMFAAALMFQSAAQSLPRPPQFELDPKWPEIPNNWVLGEVTSISVDKDDHIWVLHVPQSIPEAQRANAAPPVLEFDAAGKLLTSWGGPRDGSVWVGREHGIFVDANDFVWIGGRAGWPRATTPGVSDDMILKFTTAGKFVMQIGRSGQSKGNQDTENVHQATDVFVDTTAKEVYVADGYGNKRVIVFDSETGKFKRMWAHSGTRPLRPSPQIQRHHNRKRRLTALRTLDCRMRSKSRETALCTSQIGSTTGSRCSREKESSSGRSA